MAVAAPAPAALVRHTERGCDRLGCAARGRCGLARARDTSARIAERYRQERAALGRDAAQLPKIGITRHVVVADSDEDALRIAEAAYPRWRRARDWIWRRSGTPFTLTEIYPDDFAPLAHRRSGFA